jgi:hypothetical protein
MLDVAPPHIEQTVNFPQVAGMVYSLANQSLDLSLIRMAANLERSLSCAAQIAVVPRVLLVKKR